MSAMTRILDVPHHIPMGEHYNTSTQSYNRQLEIKIKGKFLKSAATRILDVPNHIPMGEHYNTSTQSYNRQLEIKIKGKF